MNNYERIKQMSVEEMASFFKEHFQEEENFGCLGCAFKTSQYHSSKDCEFDGEQCEYYGTDGDIKKWLLKGCE